MQIIQDDLISSTASDQSHLSSTYAVANLANDDPNLPYICNDMPVALDATYFPKMRELLKAERARCAGAAPKS